MREAFEGFVLLKSYGIREEGMRSVPEFDQTAVPDLEVLSRSEVRDELFEKALVAACFEKVRLGVLVSGETICCLAGELVFFDELTRNGLAIGHFKPLPEVRFTHLDRFESCEKLTRVHHKMY